MKIKVISAIVALAIVIPIIIYGGFPYYFSVAIIGLIGFIELINLKDKDKKIPNFVKIISVFCFICLLLSNLIYSSLFLADYKLITMVIFFLLIPLIIYKNLKIYNINDALYLLGVIFFLGISFNYLIVLRNYSLYYLVFLLLITIVSDTFAHFTGILIGRNKLCPIISPNKTVEGFIGGTLFGTFVATTFYISIFNYTGSILTLILIVAFLSVIGQLGDLVFSAIKRNYNTKDFSNLMPGHGGILDRLDSILFVLLAFSFIKDLL